MPMLNSQLATFAARLLRLCPPETAHHLALRLLRLPGVQNFLPSHFQPRLPLELELPGVGKLRHPIGLAAGFDKNGQAVPAISQLGFSFMEVGTITPHPQPGNPKPRIFRSPGERALINRLGFNNDGLKRTSQRLASVKQQPHFFWALNAGKNRDTPLQEALWDYLQCIKTFHDYAAFFVINISSPNTPDLRSLTNRQFLQELSVILREEQLPLHRVWIKLDPDMPKHLFQQTVQHITEQHFGGLILTNSHRVEKPHAGGLTGHPLLLASTQCLEWAWEIHQGRLPMIGVGGIFSGADILAKIMRGASAVEIYTALIYRGPFVVHQLLYELENELILHGYKTLQDAFGAFYRQS